MKDICNICGLSKTSKAAKETILDYINGIDPSDIITDNSGVCIKINGRSVIQLTNCNNCNARILKTFDSSTGGIDDKYWSNSI